MKYMYIIAAIVGVLCLLMCRYSIGAKPPDWIDYDAIGNPSIVIATTTAKWSEASIKTNAMAKFLDFCMYKDEAAVNTNWLLDLVDFNYTLVANTNKTVGVVVVPPERIESEYYAEMTNRNIDAVHAWFIQKIKNDPLIEGAFTTNVTAKLQQWGITNK